MKWKKVLLTVVIISVVIILFGGLFSFLGIFIDTPWEVEDLKNSLCLDMPYEKASKEKSEEFFDNYGQYGGLQAGWYIRKEMATERLRFYDINYDYWFIGDNMDIVYWVFYDTWDWMADEYVLIKNDYKYPDPETAKVNEICFAINYSNGYDKENAVKIELTEQEIEEIREFAIKEVYDENKTKCLPKEYFDGAYKRDILWFFEDEDLLYYEYGELVRTTDGKYYLRANPSYYTVYILPDEICDKINMAFAEMNF